MVSTFYRAGWTMAEFREAAIVELGCGPLGMIEYLPGARRVAFDSLNDKYGRLFGNFRHRSIEYISDLGNCWMRRRPSTWRSATTCSIIPTTRPDGSTRSLAD